MSTISSANSATPMNLSDKQVTECQELLKKLIQAPVVQILDSAIHRIYHYPANKYQGSQQCYPMDRDLFSGQHYPPFKQLAPGYYRKITKTSECLGTFVIISISIYNFGIYLILVLNNCNTIQSTDCHVQYFLINYLSIRNIAGHVKK